MRFGRSLSTRQTSAGPVAIAVVLLAAAATAVVGLPQQASAYEVSWTNHSASYSFTKDVYSTPLGMCFHLLLQGSEKYQRITYPVNSPSFAYRNPTLINPQISVYTKSSCARTGSSVYTAGGADLTQSWYATVCHVTPSINAGYPWSVSVSVTKYCGNEHVAYHKTTPRATGVAEYAQYNTGSPATFKTEVEQRALCLTVTGVALVYKGARSDSITLPDSLFCVQ